MLYMLLNAVQAKVSPTTQEEEQARWSLVYRLLPAEAGKKLQMEMCVTKIFDAT